MIPTPITLILLAFVVVALVILANGFRRARVDRQSEAERREAARRSVNRAYEHDQHWWI